MLQRQHRLPARHRAHLRDRRPLRLVPAAGRRLHGHRHRLGHRLRPRPALGGLPPPSHAAADGPRHPSHHHRVRLQHGPGLHGRGVAGDVRVRARRLLSGELVDQEGQRADADARQRGVVQYRYWHPDDAAYLWRAGGDWRHLLDRSGGGVRGVYDTYCYSGVFCRGPVQAGAVASRAVEHADWDCGLRVCDGHGADYMFAELEGGGLGVRIYYLCLS